MTMPQLLRRGRILDAGRGQHDSGHGRNTVQSHQEEKTTDTRSVHVCVC